jgi:predicted enzyme related to lactoylglutathione lyase
MASAVTGLARIEHVNLTVQDPHGAARLMEALFGWTVRWQGLNGGGGTTVHVGSAEQYIAFCSGGEIYGKGRPFNHVAIEVDDLDAVEARVAAAGLEPFAHGDYEPGRRFYFFDANGVEFEIVDYGGGR